LSSTIGGSSALDELGDRLGKTLGTTTDARSWGRFKAKWLANVDSYAADLTAVGTVSPADLDLVKANIAASRDALKESETNGASLRSKLSSFHRQSRP